jgi:hypothetical protein
MAVLTLLNVTASPSATLIDEVFPMIDSVLCHERARPFGAALTALFRAPHRERRKFRVKGIINRIGLREIERPELRA